MAYVNMAISGRVMRVDCVNVSLETREANVVEGHSCHVPPLPQLQVTGGPQQHVKRNWNVERRQRHCARRQQMKEVRKAICPANTGREAQARISSEQHQTREVRVWIPKRRAHEVRVSEALPHKRDV